MLHRENQIRQYHDGSVADLMNFFHTYANADWKKDPPSFRRAGLGSYLVYCITSKMVNQIIHRVYQSKQADYPSKLQPHNYHR